MSDSYSLTSEQIRDPLVGHLSKLELIDDIQDMICLLREERVDTSNFPQITA